ncbi:MAG: retropepsin-like aspartic protease [Saprospiraceae bacterium]
MKHTFFRHLLAFVLFAQRLLAQHDAMPYLVPFELVGNTIVVQATVNGIDGNFILDTGSPALVLNGSYFEGIQVPWMNQAVSDFHGELSKARHLVVESMDIDGLPVTGETALVVNLAPLEQTKGIPIHGIIGYTNFNEMEMLLDFDKQHALFFPTNKKGERLCRSSSYRLTDSLDLKMSGHFPCIQAVFEGKKLRLGIDTGAEANVLQSKLLKNKMGEITLTKNLEVRGIKNQRKICPRGWIKNLRIGHWDQEDREMVIANLDELNSNLNLGLDGILGVPFLKERKLAINYKSKKIYVWEDAVGTIADQEELKKLEANKGAAKQEH